jgi:glycosyltransferase involved in cell wall biosynthesis
MNTLHHSISSWRKKVDLFLLGSTQSAADKFIGAGIPAESIMLKPNFVRPDPGPGNGGGRYALFVGRFDEVKGIHDLIRAWEMMDKPYPLKIVGDGPLAPMVSDLENRMSEVEWYGRLTLDEMLNLMKKASFLVFPSRWYEAMPRTLIDSFSVGTPVVASRLGAMEDMIDEGRTGLFFSPGDASDLAAKVSLLVEQTEIAASMRIHARRVYESTYTGEDNYHLIMEAYRRAGKRHAE